MGAPDRELAARAPAPLAAPRRSPGEQAVFSKDDPDVGRLWLRRLAVPEDVALVHAWVSLEYAAYWGLVGRSVDEVREAYAEIARRAGVYLGFHGDTPAFLVEAYSPADHEIGEHLACGPGDRGMHLLVAPPTRLIHGFTWAVFKTVMDFLFADPATTRIVVEPDVRNDRIHAMNERAGFRHLRIVQLSGKVARLAACTREQYRAALARAREHRGPDAPPRRSTLAHLRPEIWADVNVDLVRKAIAELSHERLLRPLPAPDGSGADRFVLGAPGGVEYRFRARLLPLEHWDIDRSSLGKWVDGERAPVDALDFMLEFADHLAISQANLPVYLEEIANTLYGAAYKQANERFSASDLVHADFQEIEAAMTEGHPAFVANSGRVGFDAVDYVKYTPEAAAPVRLVWVAARRGAAEFHCTSDLSYEALLEDELGADALREMRSRLERQGLCAEDYLFFPVHPWQWTEKLSMVFAADIAARDLVCLGSSQDRYRAQQSVRTFFNASAPRRRYVKTALSVLNMGFMRGLSADYMRGTPAINDWIAALLAGDPYFSERRFGILREVAAFGYRRAVFEAALPRASAQRKMLAALFRESPVPELRPGERLMTMAALLHRDRAGAALLPRLIRASGLDTDAWIARYLGCYLAPLLHCFYRHDLAFMPHGENVILVLERHVPVAAWLKDIAEEAAILDTARPLPEAVRRLAVAVPEEMKTLSLFTDVFDGFLRFLCAVLAGEQGYPAERFWLRVAEQIAAYQEAFPELGERFERYDLFAPELAHSCLNRLQLRNNRHMLDLADPVKGLAFAGTLENPVARFREQVARTPRAERGVK